MPLDLPMNESHRAYVHAVAAALDAAGVPITDVDFFDDEFDDGDPLRHALTLIDPARTATAYPDRQVWAGWDERDGWDLTVYDPRARLYTCTHTLCTEVLPAPADVAAATVALLAAHPSTSTTLERPILSKWNEALEVGLDAYTRLWLTTSTQPEILAPESAPSQEEDGGMGLPDYFRNQLPEGIRQMVDHPDFTSWGPLPDTYTHWVQYTYPTVAGNGDPSNMTLATVYGAEPMSFEVGQPVCLHGVWVQVASVKTSTENADDDGRLITYHTVEVREADE